MTELSSELSSELTSTGLTTAEVASRQRAGLVNQAPPAPGRTLAQILRANVCTRFNAILGSLFVIVLIIGPPQDGLFGAVLVINTGIGVFQELRAKRELDKLAIITAARARVIRDGEPSELPVGEVVRDDVLELRPGDQVPVDALVLRSAGLELDEALLTGEAEPVPKDAGDDVMSGSFVVAGRGQVRATKVGGDAYAARLQEQARRFSLIRSELQQGTNQILRLVTWVMIPTGILVVISEFFRSHEPFLDAARGSVAAVVAMVPEGLVLLTSLAFTLGALRLARRRVLVQELAAIEGLARVDVLCVDKTGTLTEPGMRLVAVQTLPGWTDARIADAVSALLSVEESQNGTSRALAARFSGSPGWTAGRVVPFSSARKWSGASFRAEGTWLLGAPSVVGGGQLGTALVPEVASAVAGYEADGRRVLLLAHSDQALSDQAPPASAAPAALLVLAEELRPQTESTVRYLTGQGVTIKVLSGDAPGSVAAIAARAGIPGSSGAPLAAGPPLDAYALTDEEAADAIDATTVLGRVRPSQKLACVRALRRAGHVVAMIGDGVNDVPALKEADLGIAMGSGSEASRAVARVVLLDSTFASVPLILAEGRRVIANVERVAGLFVTKTGYAALIALTVGIAGIAYPFFPRHLTLISTFTIGVPGFFLALAPGAPRAHPGFTRRVLAFALPCGVAAASAALGCYAIARAADGASVPSSRTAATLAVCATGLWVLGMAARPLTAARVLLLAAMAGAIALVLLLPVGRRVFTLEIPSAALSLECAAVVLAAIAALTAWRAVARRRPGQVWETADPERKES